ncbi:uncharacterized protein PAC_10129 [Phialocephala subalpina]|uniref:Uncharacterized protein n=1 Tax=Phialocephala subalpina TaxID=576137 RepID=A0A1L7X5D3_9HELO|nr:uncharacterized protein PAC_10129 [Phialocephala subalpina]
MPLAPSGIRKVDVWGMEKRLWRDLPFFEEIALEEVNTIDTEVPETDINFDFERCRWRNFHAFIARLTGSNVVDFSKYALWEFRDAVETQNVIAGLLDFRIPVVASWLKHAGQQLFSKVGAEKWDAWRDRFEDIGNDEQLQISEETRKGVEDLVRLTQRLKRGCDSTEPPS